MDKSRQEERPFKVLKGGWLPAQKRRKIFHSAMITNTRLMGNMGLAVFWSLENWKEDRLVFQYFNLDTDAKAFESFEEFWDQSKTGEIAMRYIDTTMGCLGGKKVKLTEKEVRYLVKKYFSDKAIVSTNVEDIRQSLDFILDKPAELTRNEKKTLNRKIYAPIKGDIDRINYFLMRYFSGDREPLPYLASRKQIKEGVIRLNLFDEVTGATMSRNQATRLDLKASAGRDPDYADNIRIYRCNTILDSKDGYCLATSLVTLQGRLIVNFERVSLSKISAAEAALAMRRKEYISVYRQMEIPSDGIFSIRLPSTAMVEETPKGSLFLVFRDNNDHIAENPFLLNNDLEGVIFLSSFGNISLGAYSLENIQRMEETFEIHNPGLTGIVEKRFQFQNPILFDFIQSPFDNIYDFIDLISYDADEDDDDDGGGDED